MALIVLSIAGIIYVVQFKEDTAIVKRSPAQKKQMEAPKTPKEKPPLQKPAKEGRPQKETEKDQPPAPPMAAKPAEKQKTVVAKITPPSPLMLKRIAIIIDDIGYDMKPVRDLLRLDAAITFAVLPLLNHSRESAEMLHAAHREILLHLPMEPLSYPKEKPGNGALFTDMNEEEIVFQLEKNLASVSHIAGVNNHMGSRFMADEAKLALVFSQLKKRDLFFIDSRTTDSSKTLAAARRVQLPVASRRVFLDNERDYAKIYQILMDVADTPAGDSPLIVIGHPYPETIRAIKDALSVFRNKGVSIVPVSQLVKQKTSNGAS